jgi:predicted nucleic acid-binding protein
MPIDRVVANASPLICLSKSGLAKLLPALFKEIVVPEAVAKELLTKRNDGFRSLLLMTSLGNRENNNNSTGVPIKI